MKVVGESEEDFDATLTVQLKGKKMHALWAFSFLLKC